MRRSSLTILVMLHVRNASLTGPATEKLVSSPTQTKIKIPILNIFAREALDPLKESNSMSDHSCDYPTPSPNLSIDEEVPSFESKSDKETHSTYHEKQQSKDEKRILSCLRSWPCILLSVVLLLSAACAAFFLARRETVPTIYELQCPYPVEWNVQTAVNTNPQSLPSTVQGSPSQSTNIRVPYGDGPPNIICNLWLMGPNQQRKPLARSWNQTKWTLYAQGNTNDQVEIQCQDTKQLCVFSLPPILETQYFELLSSTSYPASAELESTNETIASNPETVQLKCPPFAESPLPLGEIAGGVLVEIPFMEAGLCTLWKVGPGSERRPLIRSYEGNPWEHYASLEYRLSDEIGLECDTLSCMTFLPPLRDSTQYYEMASSNYQPIIPDTSVARFLERATFGPTISEINSMPPKFEDWIRDQMDMPPSSHRAYFREHLVYRMSTTSPQGVGTLPCERGTRYRKYAFSKDDIGKTVTISTDSGTGRNTLWVDGQLRTALDDSRYFEDGSYVLCSALQPMVSNKIGFETEDGECEKLRNSEGKGLGNPRVIFDEDIPPTNAWVDLDGKVEEIHEEFYSKNPQELILTSNLRDPVCFQAPNVTGWPVFVVAGRYRGEWYLHDPRWKIYENTINSPKADGGAELRELVAESGVDESHLQTQCGNAPMTHVNEEGCYLSDSPRTCSTLEEIEEVTIQAQAILEPRLLRNVDDNMSQLWLSVTGLRQDEGVPYEPPCATRSRSRWIPVNDPVCSKGAPGTDTRSTFARLLSESDDPNPYVRDVLTPSYSTLCDTFDNRKFGFQVQDWGGQCWENVHQDHLQVFDFTRFQERHPGGSDAILQFTKGESLYELEFPDSHEMSRWHGDGAPFRKSIGRLGDLVEASLNEEVLSEAGEELLEVAPLAFPSGRVCGSPFEVANDLSYEGRLGRGIFDSKRPKETTTPNQTLRDQKEQVWAQVTLTATDQLRQKVAWTMYQLLAISPSGLMFPDYLTEMFMAVYDIFVRHAFGTYRDVLREVTFNPLMGEMLTFVGSKSTAFTWRTERKVEFADENYAREVMQLFSIGLFKLNKDGSRMRDASGNYIQTYSNLEIREYARLYTGFNYNYRRGNIENESLSRNPIDPMLLNLEEHDGFPKLGLDKQYIGDGVTLCRDLPKGHFLKKGAKYRLLGRVDTAEWLSEPRSWPSNAEVVRLDVGADTELYQAFCERQIDGNCQFRGMIELADDIACNGKLCQIESPRILEIGKGVFYEYIRPPCARFAFFEKGASMETYDAKSYCEEKRISDGLYACCDDISAPRTDTSFFTGERVSYHEAKRRCEEVGSQICSTLPSNFPRDDSVGHWGEFECKVLAKVDTDGSVAVVHSPNTGEDVHESVNSDTKSFFQVEWLLPIDDFLENYEEYCDRLGCTRDLNDNLCLCDVSVSERPAFDTVPTVEQASTLTVGGKAENAIGINDSSDRSIWIPIDQESVFEYIDKNHVKRRKKNLRSEVTIGTPGGMQLKFRNPTHMISLSHPELRDIYHEIDAGLDHYMYHQNIAPFLAQRFSQKFGNSNPSPRYVEAMARAFQTGTYMSGGETFGDGQYGDLSALIACLLLDREATSVVLDADPSSGSLFEPFGRFIRLLRSMELETTPTHPFVTFGLDLQARIGQMAHGLPNVFSFFRPEYQPSGALKAASLTCPECQKLNAPAAVTLSNGLLSMVKYGLDHVNGGFGLVRKEEDIDDREHGKYKWATGRLSYQAENPMDASAVVKELSLLLTAGRLSQEKMEILERVYTQELSRSNQDKALIDVLQLIVVSPEFHANSLSDNNQGLRPKPETSPTSSGDYKAVVYLMLEGGFDSYNVLVPNTCPRTTLVQQYNQERGQIALTNSERDLVVAAEGQPCTDFVVHPRLPLAKELYDEGNLAFFANTGILTQSDISKANYRETVPSKLFAHNTMQNEVKALDTLEDRSGTGTMGRISSILSTAGFNVNSIAVDDSDISVQPEATTAPEPIVASRYGFEAYSPRRIEETLDIEGYTEILNGKASDKSSMIGDLWSETFVSAIFLAQRYKTLLNAAKLGNHWRIDDYDEETNGEEFVERLKLVSKFIQTRRDRGVDRDFFYLSYGSWDHHQNVKENQQNMLEVLNEGLRMFVTELKSQGVFEDVTVVVSSEFGRTLTQNSQYGSDHGWAGHYFMFGGDVQGGKIHGSYPEDISSNSELNIGRGRILPTTSWDCIWNGISEWLGVTENNDLDYILPNRNTSAGSSGSIFSPLFRKSDLFRSK